MKKKASQIRRENQDPPTIQELLEGLSEGEVSIIFDLVLLLKERRKRNEKPKTAGQRSPKRNAEDIEDRLWFLIELIKSFMDLFEQDDSQLVDHIESWFKGLAYKPNENQPTLSFPAQTWNMFEGLSSEQWYTLIRLLSFLKEQDLLVKVKETEKNKESI